MDNAEASIMKHADWRIEICPDGRIKEVRMNILGICLVWG